MSHLEVFFIGTGEAINSGGKANQAIWIKADRYNILVDCGPTTLYCIQKYGIDINELDAIIFTHFHGDHFIGVVGLDLAMTISQRRITSIIYGGPRGLKKHFENVYKVCYENFYPNTQFIREFEEYLPLRKYHLFDTIEIIPFEMNHKKESLGYKIKFQEKSIAITGDTGWNSSLKPLSENTDLFITECSFYKKMQNYSSHLSYQELKENKNVLNSRRIVLTHTGQEVQRNKNNLDFEIAEDGMKIII